ncbi:9139_t:CDS:2, partial [Cetraspora pellucida]
MPVRIKVKKIEPFSSSFANGIAHVYKNTREESPELEEEINGLVEKICQEIGKLGDDGIIGKRNIALAYKGATEGLYQEYLKSIVGKKELNDNDGVVLKQFQEAVNLSGDEGERAAGKSYTWLLLAQIYLENEKRINDALKRVEVAGKNPNSNDGSSREAAREEKIDELEDEIVRLKSEMNDCQANLEQLEIRIQELTKEVTDYQNGLKGIIKEGEASLTNWKSKIEKKVIGEERTINDLKNQLSTLTNEKDSLVGSCATVGFLAWKLRK